jgi:hypothetical protein
MAVNVLTDAFPSWGMCQLPGISRKLFPSVEPCSTCMTLMPEINVQDEASTEKWVILTEKELFFLTST